MVSRFPAGRFRAELGSPLPPILNSFGPPSISSPLPFVSLPLRVSLVPPTAVLFGSGAGYLLSLPSLAPAPPSVHPESSVRQLGAIAPRESLVSGCALPLTASHRKPIETSRLTLRLDIRCSLSLTRGRELYFHFTLSSPSFFSSDALSLCGLFRL